MVYMRLTIVRKDREDWEAASVRVAGEPGRAAAPAGQLGAVEAAPGPPTSTMIFPAAPPTLKVR